MISFPSDRSVGMPMSDYKVQLEVFEGPLDLLLYLIKKEEVDIYEVNLTKIATQFIAYIESMRRLDLEIAGEFLVMAATLMYIKSRELLPVDQQALVEGEEETLDPRWELIRQLVEYKKFKDMAGQFHALEAEQELVYPRLPGKPALPQEILASRKSSVTLMDLLQAVGQVLQRFDRREGVEEILDEKWTVSEKITLLMQQIATRPGLKFSELFAAATSRTEVIVTFLALLELVRLKLVQVVQPEPFGDIEISRSDPSGSESDSEFGTAPTLEAPPLTDPH
jgi:segregation and condensation protein A